MKIAKEDITDILELLDEANEFKPLVRKVIKILMEYRDEFKELFDGIQDCMINSRVKTIHKYQNLGFTKDEAILFTLDSKVALQTHLKNIKIPKT